jgi:hypothetical protein
MPVLENTRWELFAKQVAAGKTYTNAYKSLKSKAKDPAKAGSALASNPEVRGRIDELARRATNKCIERVSARVAITKEWVLRELLDNAELAKADGSWAARNRSLELVGKEIGMFGDQEPPKPPRLEDLSDEDLQRMLAESIAANPPAEPPQEPDPPTITQ